MTVPTEACDATLSWSGVETSYNLAFRAKEAAHVYAKYIDADLIETALTLDTHYSVALDPSTEVATLTVIDFPEDPGAVYVWRDTPATQSTDFEDLEDFSAATHTDLHDRAAMRDAEQKRRIARMEVGFASGFAAAVAAATYAASQYAATAAAAASAASGSASAASVALAGGVAARDKAQLWAEQPEDATVETAPNKYSAKHWAAKSTAQAALCAGYAAILGNPDDGIFGDAETLAIDDGAFP